MLLEMNSEFYNVAFKTACPRWTREAGLAFNNGHQVLANTEQACRTACVNVETCYGINYVSSTQGCYIAITGDDTRVDPDAVLHRFRRYCPGTYASYRSIFSDFSIFVFFSSVGLVEFLFCFVLFCFFCCL